jgi:hypothetical protein
MMLKNDGRQREAQHNMAKWSHHLCVFLFVYFTAEEFPPPFSNLDLPNHPRKSTKTESEVGTGVEWMGYFIKFDMHCVGEKSLSLYIPLRCDQSCFE